MKTENKNNLMPAATQNQGFEDGKNSEKQKENESKTSKCTDSTKIGSKNFKSKYSREKMILRDDLALERTVLANERTLLAYFRSAIATFAAGVALFEFIDHIALARLGILFIAVSPIIFIVGVVKYFIVRKKWNFLR